ncbi:MAG: hypothetical protein U0Q16_26265 [Bryobacteraceae bacterium]
MPPEIENQRPAFDRYSWQAFLAVVCDQKTAGTRGEGDPAGTWGGTRPAAFEGFKSNWELFHHGPIKDWDAMEDHNYSPCSSEPAARDQFLLASTSKFDVLQAGSEGALGIALPAQNGTYVRYLTQYNKTSADYISKVMREHLHGKFDFPVGSVNIKSAWVEMKGHDSAKDPDPSLFHTREAWIRDAGATGGCRKALFGLVGLHIVQKTKGRPRWIWSTFEHVNNAPDSDICPPAPAGGPFTFHDGSCKTMEPSDNDVSQPPTKMINVWRTRRIDRKSTAPANQEYRQKLSQSKWRNYRLVTTQWPIGNPPAGKAGDPEYSFPGKEGHPFANVTMETFLQNAPKTSCLGCHAQALTGDFVWSILLERPATMEPSLKLLRSVLENSGMLRK